VARAERHRGLAAGARQRLEPVAATTRHDDSEDARHRRSFRRESRGTVKHADVIEPPSVSR